MEVFQIFLVGDRGEVFGLWKFRFFYVCQSLV